MSLGLQVEELRRQFARLAQEKSVEGLDLINSGLAQLIEDLDGVENTDHLTMVLHHLSGIARLLESSNEDDPQESDWSQNGEEGLERFVSTFRKDAGKRLRGLSISLMGVFNDEASDEALEQSIDHLHAIRGSAAMLGLDDIARLSAALENTLQAMAAIAPAERRWPTKTILRGFALLEEAVDQKPPALADPQDAEAIFSVLEEDTSHKISSTPSAPSPDKGEGEDGKVQNDEGAITPGHRLEQPILVVDDVDTIAASVAFILSELEVPIEIASNGQEALQMLDEKPFSLVISDVDMPRMDGIALTKMIRSTDQWSQLPVILLTSLDHPEERQAGLDVGATDYIIKGAIGGGELLSRVRELLAVAPVVERRKQTRQRRILVAEDTETVAASIAFVLSEGPFEIVVATDGKDALRHLDNESFDLLITDMQMPYMSGTELVGNLRDKTDLEDLPVIMLTSVDDQKLAAEAFDAGVNRYLLKGEIAGGKLLSVVEELLPEL